MSVACPVNVGSLADVALMVTGPPTAAVQVAVTCIAGEAERWTEGSLTVQLELTKADVFAVHTLLPVKRFEAAKLVLFAGAVAVWSMVIEAGVTFNAVNVQLEEEELPPQPATPNNAAQNRTPEGLLHPVRDTEAGVYSFRSRQAGRSSRALTLVSSIESRDSELNPPFRKDRERGTGPSAKKYEVSKRAQQEVRG